MTARWAALRMMAIAGALGGEAPRVQRSLHYYDPGRAPQPHRPSMGGRPATIAKETRQLRRAREREARKMGA